MSNPNTKHILKSLTGLRGLSCFFVILCHCSNEIDMARSGSLSEGGAQTVYFFFVLSGYLLMKRGLSEIQPTKDQFPNRFFNMRLVFYCIRRFFRIYPPYFVSLFFYKFLMAITTDEDYERYGNFKWYVFDLWDAIFFGKLSCHLWTMLTEMKFYFLMLPPILIISAELMRMDYKNSKNSSYKLLTLFYAVITGIVIYITIDNGYISGGWKYRHNFYVTIPIFWFGCLGGIISHYLTVYKVHIETNTPSRQQLVEVITYLIILRLAIGNAHVAKVYLHIDPSEERWWQSQILLCPFYTLLLLVLDIADSNCSIGKMMSTEFFYKMGEISYSTYLIHYFAILLVETKIGIVEFDGNVLAMLLAHLMGYLLWTFVENPAVRVGNNLIKKFKQDKGDFRFRAPFSSLPAEETSA
jgi:peptidoglycan/LPS O-acetylase OafA/YrhL